MGKWRAVETTGLATNCGGYEVFETDEQNAFRVHLSPVKIDAKLRLRTANDFSTGFTEESPIELLNKANLRVFDTDYENYAGVVECKNADGVFFVSATIGSRSGSLSNEVTEKLKQQLTSYGVDVATFKTIRQDVC
jgi:hypothetical protein